MSSNTCWKPGLYCCNLAPESSSTVFKHDLRLYVREVGEGIFRTLNRIWNLSIAVQAARSHIWPMLTASALKSFQQSSSDISFKLIQQLYHFKQVRNQLFLIWRRSFIKNRSSKNSRPRRKNRIRSQRSLKMAAAGPIADAVIAAMSKFYCGTSQLSL